MISTMSKIERGTLICAVCLEQMGYIMDRNDPASCKTFPMDWPLRGAVSVIDLHELVHVIAEEVHRGWIVVESGLVIGTPRLGTLDCLANPPVGALRYKGVEVDVG